MNLIPMWLIIWSWLGLELRKLKSFRLRDLISKGLSKVKRALSQWDKTQAQVFGFLDKD
jgi:hypothetical protein